MRSSTMIQEDDETSVQHRVQTWHDPTTLHAAAQLKSLPPSPSEIPVIHVDRYLESAKNGFHDGRQHLEQVAAQLSDACQRVGFFILHGHGVPLELIQEVFKQAVAFHSLPLEDKLSFAMNDLGTGYMPVGQRKLPTREKGNLNEAFFIKQELGPRNITLDRNIWPPEHLLPGFRSTCTAYATALESLARQLLPAFTAALQLPDDFFAPAFTQPLWRLRLSHYPPTVLEDNQFGIAPHVDTTFITLLAQSSPGLCVLYEGSWVSVPYMPGTLIVNTGHLLRKWTNDVWTAALHFANNAGDGDRYSIPFFLNCNADYVMHCLPTCCGPDNPPKYPPHSYLQSEALVQGE